MSWLRYLLAALLVLPAAGLRADVYNLRVVTDASPDYTDLESMVHSATSRWDTPAEQVWAMFYWNHIARRQTAPMHLHGMALTDPIRQFNDYGHTMCSTIAGINCSIWHAMGFPVRYWDITLHTVSEVYYDGRWHMVDNSMSALYTLCDGRTIAGVEDIGQPGACEASGGVVEPGHIAKYHCLNATSPNGFLTGADTIRDLEQEYRCFNPSGLKHRYYYHDWDRGHRYIWNVRRGESYTRHYHSLGETPAFYVPNRGKDPEAANPRYRIRGNGVWDFQPDLSAAGSEHAGFESQGVRWNGKGLQPAVAGDAASAVFKVQSANVTTSQRIRGEVVRGTPGDRAAISVSTDNGLSWTPVWSAETTGVVPIDLELVEPVNGAYEVLLRVELEAKARPEDCVLHSFQVQTTTMLNSKTQPRLNVGRNTVYVGGGDPTDSIVFWPELQAGRYRQHIVEEKNIASVAEHPGYQGAVHPQEAGEDAYLVYRLDAPRDLTRLTFGGRFYNRAPQSRCELLYSLDGQTWTKVWELTDTEPPWDVIHYETVEIPRGHRSVWAKYLMNTSAPRPSGCSLYAVRLEANHLPSSTEFHPLDVTFRWSEPQADRRLVQRSHRQRIDRLPFTYTLDVGGADHPVVHSLQVAEADATAGNYGYSDGAEPAAEAEKFVGRWVSYGRNLAVGKPYTCSAPSLTNWDAGDPDGTKLTDGVTGPPCSGGTSYRAGAIWKGGTDPVITLDLEAPADCASFGMNFHGYPGWDALKGEVQDRVEVLTSLDGRTFTSQGFLETDLRWKDLPVNHMWPDDEKITGHTFRLVPEGPVQARYVQYRVSSQRMFDCTELEVLDAIRFEPFALRIALPEPVAKR